MDKIRHRRKSRRKATKRFTGLYLLISFLVCNTILIFTKQRFEKMENKLVAMILIFLEDGEKPRHKVTMKIRNYPKDMRDGAIRYIMSEKLVQLRECRENCGRGRTPVFISLTEKGSERVMEISRRPRHKSVWEI